MDNIQYFGVKGRFFQVNTQFFYKKLSHTAKIIYLDLCARRNWETGQTIPRKTPGGSSPEYQKQRRALAALVESGLLSENHRFLTDLNLSIWAGYTLEQIFLGYAKYKGLTARDAEKKFHFRTNTLSKIPFFEVVKMSPNENQMSPNENQMSPNENKMSPNENKMSPNESNTIINYLNNNHHRHVYSIEGENLKKDDDDFLKEISLRVKGRNIKNMPAYIARIKQQIREEGFVYLEAENKRIEAEKRREAEQRAAEAEKEAKNSLERSYLGVKMLNGVFVSYDTRTGELIEC